MTIAYEKYENMNRGQLLKSLDATENKIHKLQKEIANYELLGDFIRKELQNKINRKSISYTESESYKVAKSLWQQLSQAERDEISNEVERDMMTRSDDD